MARSRDPCPLFAQSLAFASHRLPAPFPRPFAVTLSSSAGGPPATKSAPLGVAGWRRKQRDSTPQAVGGFSSEGYWKQSGGAEAEA